MNDIMKYIMAEVDKVSNNSIKDRLKDYFINQDNVNEVDLEIDLFKTIDEVVEMFLRDKYKDKIDPVYMEDIINFIKFHKLSIIIEKSQGSSTLINIAKKIFDIYKIEDLDEESMKDIDDWIKEDKDFKKFYNKLCRDFSNLEKSKYFISEAGVKISQKNNQYGRSIPISNVEELSSLNKIWTDETKVEKDIMKIYKKINFDNIESMKKINYIDFIAI